MINDGIKLLEELEAVVRGENGNLKLTEIGEKMSRFPCEPRFSRMLVEADKKGALHEVLIICSALSAQEVRERPLAFREKSDECHKRFNDEKSDFKAYLNLYDYLQNLKNTESASQMKRTMKKEFLSFLRMREWMDIYSQLREAAKDIGFKENQEPATYEELHMSLLVGLLGQIGMKTSENYEYQGARSNRFYLFPGSGISKKAPKWVMAAEIAETSKVYARTVAEIDPLWVEKLAPRLIKYSWSDEYWSKKSGAVLALEKGTFYGLPLFSDRRVNFTKHDPALCRELFIREALVNGEFQTNDEFFKHNLSLVSEVEDLEEKSRRRDILVSEETLFAFYDEKIPDDIADARTFEKWWQRKHREEPNFLDYDIKMLQRKDTSEISPDMYPDHIQVNNFRIPLTYNFDPTKENDGVTAVIPVSVLNQIPEDIFLWLIPGLRLELFTQLIKTLPKVLRRHFVPAPDYAAKINESIKPEDGYFWDVLIKKMTALSGPLIKKDDFVLTSLPTHLTFYFRVVNSKNRLLMEGRSLEHIKSKLKDEMKNSLAEVLKDVPKSEKSSSWTFGDIPESQTRNLGGLEVVAYPALHDAGTGVTMELYGTTEEAESQMHKGLKRLIMLSIPSPLKFLEEKLPNKAKLSMYFNAVGSVKSLIEDLESLALDNLIEENGGNIRKKDDFLKITELAKSSIYDRVLSLATVCEKILVKANEVRKKLKGKMDFQIAYAWSDMGGQLSHLIYKGFASDATMKYFPEIERYLDAILKRMEKVPRDPNRDLLLMNHFQAVEENYESLLGYFSGKIVPKDVHLLKYMLEELRVSLFAQGLKTMYPVSEKRVNSEIERLRKLYRG